MIPRNTSKNHNSYTNLILKPQTANPKPQRPKPQHPKPLLPCAQDACSRANFTAQSSAASSLRQLLVGVWSWRFQGEGARVWSLRVQGLRFGVQGFSMLDLGFGLQVQYPQKTWHLIRAQAVHGHPKLLAMKRTVNPKLQLSVES